MFHLRNEVTSRSDPRVNTNLKSRRRTSSQSRVTPRRRQSVRTRTRRSNRPRPTRHDIIIFLNTTMRRRSSRRTRRHRKRITMSTPKRKEVINRPLILKRRTRSRANDQRGMSNPNRNFLTLSVMTLAPSMMRRRVRCHRNSQNSPLTRARLRDMTIGTNNTRDRYTKRRVRKVANARRRDRPTGRLRLNKTFTIPSRTSTRKGSNRRVGGIGGHFGSHARHGGLLYYLG